MDALLPVLKSHPGPSVLVCSLLFRVVHQLLQRLPVPKVVKQNELHSWKWRNLSVSMVHSLLTGAWALICVAVWPETLRNLHSYHTPLSYLLVCVSTGYFVQDAGDIILTGHARASWEFLLHHALVIWCFLYTLYTEIYVAGAVVALFVEVNSVTLHMRLMLKLAGAQSSSVYYINKFANLLTYVAFRLSTQFYLTWYIVHNYTWLDHGGYFLVSMMPGLCVCVRVQQQPQSTMMTTKRLDKFEVVCEWAACNFKGHTMVELSDHMSLHLKDYLGDNDALEELDEYACLWNGCEFLSMGSPAELEVHAYFHNYHGKLKFVGSQLLKSRPDLPSCNQGLHSNNLVPEGSDSYVCQWEHCDSTFNNPEWFYRHVDNHVESAEPESLSQEQQVLFCHWTGCDAFFKIRYRLREHMRSHTQERLVACPTCGSMFSSNTKLFDHLHRQAEPVESLVCEHCGKAFSSERLLRDHVRQHVNQVKCPFCDMTCTTLAALKIHIRFRHCDERPFPCDFCDKRFKNQRDLQKHTEVHNEGTVYHCTVEGCDYSCHTFQTMSHHFKRVHEVGGMSKYKCHICDKVFSWCYTLTLHLRKKHELKWPSGHSRFRYRKDVDGFLKVNMVRFETVEVTKEIMKNMATKPQSLRKSQRTSSRNKRAAAAATPESGRSSPAGSSSPSSSSSSSYSSELSGGEDVSSQPSPRGSDSPVYCVMSTIPHIEEEPGGFSQEDCDGSGTSGAVQALTEVARGLGMDVV